MKIFKSLKSFRKEYKLTQEDVANLLNVTKQSVSAFGRTRPLPDNHRITLEKKFNCKLDIDYKKGENFDFIELPVRGEVSASMGCGITVYDETQTGTYKISKELAKDLNINSNASEVIFASGDSMYPTIEGGDIIIVDKNKTDIYDGKIYCVRIDGQLYAKRLQLIPPKQVKVISDNKDKYDSFYVDLSKQVDYDFAVIGEVKYWGRIAK